MQKKIVNFIIIVAIIIAVSLVVAWGASSYFGERHMGQKLLLPPETDVLSYASFVWPMNSRAEIEYEDEHLGSPVFKGGYLTFSSKEDTYFYLNLRDHKIISELHRFISVSTVAQTSGSAITISLFPVKNDLSTFYVSHYYDLPRGRETMEFDLDQMDFYKNGNPDDIAHWGVDFNLAEAVRIDVENFNKGKFSIKEARIRPGSIHRINLASSFSQGEANGTATTGKDRFIKLAKKTKRGTFISPPIGVGTITRFLDIKMFEPNPLVKVEVASGQGTAQGIDWNEWVEVPETGWIADMKTGNYLRVKLNLEKQPEKKMPMVSGFSLRTIDSTPPGMSGPLFGTAQLPTLTNGQTSSSVLEKGTNSSWIRLPLGNDNFENELNDLIAADVNVVGSLNLDIYREQKILEFINDYSSRILVWELYSTKKKSSSFYTGLFLKIKKINPVCLIFPERIGSDYFQSLALTGTYQFSESQGAKEEILNRGFWWYFVISILALLIIIALSELVGYNFNFGIKELKYFGICLGAMVVILIPAILLTGLGTINLPESFYQIQIAFTRFVFSSLLQEFILALLLLLQVYYLSKTSLGEKKSWILAVSLTSVLFGLTHLGYPSFSPQEVFGMVTVTTLMGLMTGWVFYKCRSLTVNWIIHLIANIFLSTMTSIASRM